MSELKIKGLVRGTTASGFDYSLPADAADNMELIDALADAMGDSPVAISRVCRLFLGDETRKALYDHLRQPDGRVPTAAVMADLMEIFGAFGQAGKN